MTVTLGADPEAMLYSSDGRLSSASDHFEMRGSVGTDGCRSTLEFRPAPATTAKGLLAEVRKCALKCYRSVGPGYTLKAGSYQRAPIGGHIHFGVPMNNSLVHALDVVYAGLVGVEHRDENARRRAMYGGLGDAREQPHGFEYRVPGSWLCDKTAAEGILSALHAVVCEYPRGNTPEWVRGLSCSTDPSIRGSFNRGMPAAGMTTAAGRLLADTTLYKTDADYHAAIDAIMGRAVMSSPWNEEADVFDVFGVRNERVQRQVFLYTDDAHLDAIAERLGNIRIRYPVGTVGAQVKVYGLAASREIDLAASDPRLVELLTAWTRDHAPNLRVGPLPIYSENGRTSLGLHANLRVNEATCADLLRYVAEHWRPTTAPHPTTTEAAPPTTERPTQNGLVSQLTHGDEYRSHRERAVIRARELGILPEGQPIPRAACHYVRPGGRRRARANCGCQFCRDTRARRGE